MKASCILIVGWLSYLTTTALSFSVITPVTPLLHRGIVQLDSSLSLFVQSQQYDDDNNDDDNNNNNGKISLFRRRDVLTKTVVMTSGVSAFSWFSTNNPATAVEMQNVVVAGATGQTGSRIYQRLKDQGFTATGGVRNVGKANLPGNIQHLDVVEDSLESLTNLLKGNDGLIIACGMNPGKNLLRLKAAAHEVDNIGTKKLIQAAKDANVQKVVLVSSILTNGRAWGQENSPGFVATNAFGNALDEKLEAENYLKSSGLNYTIIRPGGLKSKPPTGALSIHDEDTLNAGEISRDLVANVCVAALRDPKTNNKVLEIIEDENVPPQVFNGLIM